MTLKQPYLLTEAMLNTAALIAGALTTLVIWGLGFLLLRTLRRARERRQG